MNIYLFQPERDTLSESLVDPRFPITVYKIPAGIHPQPFELRTRGNDARHFLGITQTQNSAFGDFLGDSFTSELSDTQRKGIESALGLPVGAITNTRFALIVRELVTRLADPTGNTYHKPILGRRVILGNSYIPLAGQVKADPDWQAKALERKKLDYAKIVDQYGIDKARNWLYVQNLYQDRYGFNAENIAPGVSPDPNDPQIDDTFTEGVDTSLDAHTPTPTNWGSWVEHRYVADVIAAGDYVQGASTGGDIIGLARADNGGFSIDDMWAQIDVIAHGAADHSNVAILEASDNSESYVGFHQNAGGRGSSIYKVTSTTTYDQLAGPDTVVQTPTFTMYIERDSVDLLTMKQDGGTVLTVTNGDLSGNLYAAIGARELGVHLDNFSADEIAAASGNPWYYYQQQH